MCWSRTSSATVNMLVKDQLGCIKCGGQGPPRVQYSALFATTCTVQATMATPPQILSSRLGITPSATLHTDCLVLII